MFRPLALLILALAAPATAADPLSVGVAATDITPPLGYPMAGYFSARGATGTLDPLLAKAIVFKQGDVTAALVVGDLISIDRQLTDLIRQRVEAETGIPAAHLIVAATHSHTGPNYRPDLVKYISRASDDPLPENDQARYIPHLVDRMSVAVIEAFCKAKPATLRVGAAEEHTVAFNRRGLLKDGTVRTWARHDDKDVVGPAGPTDPEVGLVAILPQSGDAPVAALVNFALHCDTVGGSQYSADYPGHIQRVLQKELGPGFTSLFATGPCGDINHIDYAHGATKKTAADIGERLANAALKALPDLKPAEPTLAAARSVIDMPLQSYTPEDLAWAEDIIARDRKGEQLGTPIEAKAYKIHKLHLLRTGKADLGRDVEDAAPPSLEGPRETLPAEVHVIRLAGDTALVALPGEVFVELGLAIKQASPFEHTFVVELANDSPAYVPTKKAFEQGGYEAANSLYAPGSGERLVETALRILTDLK
jgi:neutral ceramidase